MSSWKRAKQTVADVEKWGRESSEYANEQRVKRGETPKPKPKKGKP